MKISVGDDVIRIDNNTKIITKSKNNKLLVGLTYPWIENECSEEELKMLIKYREGKGIEYEDKRIWINKGNILYISEPDGIVYTKENIITFNLKTRHIQEIMIMLYMSEEQILEYKNSDWCGTFDNYSFEQQKYDYTYDDEEVHLLRFKKGSPYICQKNEMDKRVWKLIEPLGAFKTKFPFQVKYWSNEINFSHPIIIPFNVEFEHRVKLDTQQNCDVYVMTKLFDCYVNPNQNSLLKLRRN